MEDLYKTILNGDMSLFRNYYERNKQSFIDTFRKRFQINSIQAEELYKKANLIFVRLVVDQGAIANQESESAYDLISKIGEKVITDDFTADELISNKTWLSLIRTELKEIESIPENLYQIQKTLDDRCKKLLIFLYYEKIPASRVMELMEITDESEMDSLKKDCLSKINI